MKNTFFAALCAAMLFLGQTVYAQDHDSATVYTMTKAERTKVETAHDEVQNIITSMRNKLAERDSFVSCDVSGSDTVCYYLYDNLSIGEDGTWAVVGDVASPNDKNRYYFDASGILERSYGDKEVHYRYLKWGKDATTILVHNLREDVSEDGKYRGYYLLNYNAQNAYPYLMAALIEMKRNLLKVKL